MDFPVYLIHLIVAHPFGYMAFALVFTILMAIVTNGHRRSCPPKALFIRTGISIRLLHHGVTQGYQMTGTFDFIFAYSYIETYYFLPNQTGNASGYHS